MKLLTNKLEEFHQNEIKRDKHYNEMIARIDSIFAHTEPYIKDVKQIGSDLKEIQRYIIDLLNIFQHDDEIKKLKNDVSDFQNSFTLSVESRLDDYEKSISTISQDNKLLSRHLEALQKDRHIDVLKEEIDEEMKKINTRLNNIDYTEDTHTKAIQDVEKSIEKIDKFGQFSWQKINDRLKIMKAHVENIKTKVHDQKSSEMSQLSIMDTKLKLNERMKRLESALVRHEDVLNTDKRYLIDNPQSRYSIEEPNNCMCREYANDFSCLLRDFERRVRALEDSNNSEENSLFRDQLIVDFDSLKRAVSEDIINLNCKINDVESKLNDNLSKANKKFVIKRVENPSNRPTNCLKKVSFNLQTSRPTFESDFESDKNNEFDANNSGNLLNYSPENSIIIKSQKTLDTSLPSIYKNKEERIRNRRQDYMQNRTLDRNPDRRVYYRDLTPVAEIVNSDDYLSNNSFDKYKKGLSNRGKSADMRGLDRTDSIHARPHTRPRHMKIYSFDRNAD